MEPKRDLVPPRPQYFPYWSVVIAASDSDQNWRAGRVSDLRPALASVGQTLVSGAPSQSTRGADLQSRPSNSSQHVPQRSRLSAHQGTTLYHARHSGASTDRAGQHRTLSEVQKRGRWRSPNNVFRCDKSSRLAADFNALPLQSRCWLDQLVQKRQAEGLLAGRP